MKQKDIALIMVVVFVAGIFSYFLSKALFASPKKREAKVEVVKAIDTEFPQEPDTRYFNGSAIDPTQLIRIGDSTNPEPFDKPN